MNSEGCTTRRITRQIGFTLIELLLALAVLAVVAGIVVPSFLGSYLKHRAMDQAVASVMESMLTAKQRAIQSATPYAYEFTRGTNRQYIYPLRDPQTKQAIALPEGFHLDSEDLANTNRMIFREDGSTEGITVSISNASQKQAIEVKRRLGIPRRVYR